MFAFAPKSTRAGVAARGAIVHRRAMHTRPSALLHAMPTSAEGSGGGMPVSSGGSSGGEPQGHQTTSILFSIDGSRAGALADTLDVFQRHGINMTKLESRPSRNSKEEYEFYADVVGSPRDEATATFLQELRAHQDIGTVLVLGTQQGSDVVWFPRTKTDLNVFNGRVLSAGADLESDHPGFSDPVYRERRQVLAKLADEFRTGDELPYIDYDDNEKATWRAVYTNLMELIPTHACNEYQYVLPLLQQNCGYGPDQPPQLRDINRFLKECTGFTMRPVSGLLSSRDFLNSLAFRVFQSTQYIRHHSKPLYTPEPDICHELIGHVPLFADPEFAEFSQQIGLASLGASDDDIQKLATCYWFTVEFGLCRQGDELRAYGAGLLSSFGELAYSLSDEPEVLPFDPQVAGVKDYPITTYQPTYFVAESFRDAKEKMISFAATMNRPFEVRYDALTEKVEVLDSKDRLVALARSLRNDVTLLQSALAKFSS